MEQLGIQIDESTALIPSRMNWIFNRAKIKLIKIERKHAANNGANSIDRMECQ